MAQQKQDELSIVKEIPNTFAPQLPPDKEPRHRATEKMNQFSTIILKKMPRMGMLVVAHSLDGLTTD